MFNNISKIVEIGVQYSGIIPISIASKDRLGKPNFFICKCARCGSIIGEIYKDDITHYKVRCCNNCDPNDLTGMRFGKLVATSKIVVKKSNGTQNCEAWICKCDCGKEKIIRKDSLVYGMTRSCGCIHNYNIIGKRFGHLTVEQEIGVTKDSGQRMFYCKCDCGTTTIVAKGNLVNGHTRSCGRCARTLDLTGKRFGMLTVLRIHPYLKFHTNRVWICKCDCGKEIYVPGHSLVIGHTRSCGCLRSLNKLTPDEDRLRDIWLGMKYRCYSSTCKAYPDYGGRGIKVCNEWLLDKKNFINWSLENGYKQGLTLDRINVNGPYSPDNCRWVDWITQANNKRNTLFIDVDGDKRSLSQWCRYLNVNRWKMHGLYKKNGPEFIAMLVRRHRQKEDKILGHPMHDKQEIEIW